MAGPSTTAVHGGERYGSHGAVNTPIVHATTYDFPEVRAGDGWAKAPYIYTRYDNPTIEAVEAKLAALEGPEAAGAFLFASGLAAEQAVFRSFLSPGDTVAVVAGAYGGTVALLQDEVVPGGVTLERVPVGPPQIPAGTRLVWLESITNPLLRVPDIAAWAAAAHDADAVLAVDATFATPLLQRPLAFGADVVVHSATKYLNGHTDVTAGAVCYRARDRASLWTRRRNLGATLDPIAASLVGRGMKTLALRMQRHGLNGVAVARAAQEAGVVVHHPGLPSHPDHEAAGRMLAGPTGMVTLDVGTAAAARAFRRALRVMRPAASLGGVESLVSLPLETSHAYVPDDVRRAEGVTDGLVRISCGIEDAHDLVEDVLQAVDAARNA